MSQTSHGSAFSFPTFVRDGLEFLQIGAVMKRCFEQFTDSLMSFRPVKGAKEVAKRSKLFLGFQYSI